MTAGAVREHKLDFVEDALADTCTSGAAAAAQTSQPEAECVLADDSKDFEGGRPRRRACASQVWKLQPVQTHSMKKTAHEFLFYEKNGT